MEYDFETVIDRYQTNSEKWHVLAGELPLTTADMDLKVAPEILEAMHAKVEWGVFGYEYPPKEYFLAVASWYEKQHQTKIELESMRFVSGVVPAITACVTHFSQAGDNVLLLEPGYNIFHNSILNSGRHVLASELKYERKTLSYTIDWQDLTKKLADPLTTMMILCNPHNPTGTIWHKAELLKLLRLAKRFGVLVLSDEIHGDLVLDESTDYTPTFALPQEAKENLITLVSPSKTFNLAALHAATGIVSNEILRQRFERAINKAEIAEPDILAVPATIAAYQKGAPWLQALKLHVRNNRAHVARFLEEKLPKLQIASGKATYLLWIDVSQVTNDSQALAQFLKVKTGLLVNPGTYYGGNGKNFIRLNLAYPLSQLKDGLTRLQQGLEYFQREAQ